jgi:hypothetical protein
MRNVVVNVALWPLLADVVESDMVRSPRIPPRAYRNWLLREAPEQAVASQGRRDACTPC